MESFLVSAMSLIFFIKIREKMHDRSICIMRNKIAHLTISLCSCAQRIPDLYYKKTQEQDLNDNKSGQFLPATSSKIDQLILTLSIFDRNQQPMPKRQFKISNV